MAAKKAKSDKTNKTNKLSEKLKARAKSLKSKICAVFLAIKRKDTPFFAKIMAALTVGYALSPIDLVPDFIPILGYLDDLIILPLMIAACVKLIPPEIMAECEKQAEGMWSKGKPKKWYYALPIIAVWPAVVLLIIKCFIN